MEKKTEADIRDAGKLGTPAELGAPADEKRRRLAKAAFATPVLGALASKSALGAARQCSASVLASGNTSTPVDYLTCKGCSPGFWLKAVYQNPSAHECHWPCGISTTATVGTVLGIAPGFSGSDTDYNDIRDAMVNWTVDRLNADSKNDFRDAVKIIVGDNSQKDYANALFMFTRAAVAATLNAKTLGAAFGGLLDSNGGPLPSLTTITGYVNDVFNATDITSSQSQAGSRQALLHSSWDDGEETACSMFSNCNSSSMTCGEL